MKSGSAKERKKTLGGEGNGDDTSEPQEETIHNLRTECSPALPDPKGMLFQYNYTTILLFWLLLL
jgi:hypothetical protein